MLSLCFGFSTLEERKGQMKSTMPRTCMVLLERCRPVLLLTVFAVAFTTIAFAQRDMGTITGTITDAQGGVVPNAKITLIEVATGQKYVAGIGRDEIAVVGRQNHDFAGHQHGTRKIHRQRAGFFEIKLETTVALKPPFVCR